MATQAAPPTESHLTLPNEAATAYLTSLLNKALRISIRDGRMFIGELKCTDKERNVVLARTYEYRPPSARKVAEAAANAASSDTSSLKLSMVRRYVGLVVVPGEYIIKVEVD